MLDYYLAPYVAKSFVRNCCKWLEIRYNMDPDWLKEQIVHALDPLCIKRKGIMDDDGIKLLYPYYQKAIKHFSLNLNSDAKEQIVFFQMTKWSKEQTRKDTYQAMEAMIHNLNTLQSRAGAQTPFSSVNFGTDTSPEGRMVVMEFLNAQEAGLGNHETAIFPISIFKMKKGVNDKGSPNYDLFHRACEVSAKRLYPKNWAS